jgi:hypothetical protein
MTGARQDQAAPVQKVTLAWHLRALDADPTRSVGRGTGQTIAFLDTGFEASALASFNGRVVDPWNASTGTTQPLSDPNGHGTAMAVIAAGGGEEGVWGIAPSAQIMPIVVADEYGHATPAALASGIGWAVDHRATVINISLASMVANAAVARAISRALAAGIAVVAAAGDLGDPGPEFPASMPEVVAAYGQDRNGNPGPHSNTPDERGVSAPGESVDSLVPSAGVLRVQKINGSSAAASVLSGILASCLSAAKLPGPADKLCVAFLAVRPPDHFIDLGNILKEVS